MKMEEISLIGITIDGYKILQVIGQGGFATVYLAESNTTGEKVAIKMARSGLFLDELITRLYEMDAEPFKELSLVSWPPTRAKKIYLSEINQILGKEAEFLEKISHINFVKVLNKGFYYGRFYLILEYINGRTLREIIIQDKAVNMKHFTDTLDALIEARQYGLKYHGDIKPENIMVTHDGIIKILDPSSLCKPPLPYITTPPYNPFFKFDDINPFGVMLYEISTGFLPFMSTIVDNNGLSIINREKIMLSNFISPIYLNPDIPKKLNDIILKSLHVKTDGDKIIYEEGYKALHEMENDFKEIMAESGISSLKVIERDKTNAVMRAISPYLKKEEPVDNLKRVVNHIINYKQFAVSTIKSSVSNEFDTPPAKSVYNNSYDFPFEVGDLLTNRYEIKGIQQTGFAIVCTCYDLQENTPVVIRTIPDRALLYTSHAIAFKEHFINASNLWLSLPKHKNIHSAFAFDEIEERPCLFLDYVNAGTLRDWIKDAWINLYAVNVLEMFDTAIQVCDGMDYIYREKKIVHRDIKPERILLSKDVQITGFELAFVADEQKNADSKGICGTPLYMSPEHFEGLTDNRSDIYSFGCVLYEMLTGEPPFYLKSSGVSSYINTLKEMHQKMELKTLAPGVLNGVVIKCLEKKPENRYQSFGELKEELEMTKRQITRKEDL